MTSTRAERIYALLAGTTLIGGLAACSPSATDEPDTSAPAGGSSPEAESSDGSSADSSEEAPAQGGYTDGTYTATGGYVSPGGQETVDVELTLASDVVTDVTVTTHGSNPNSQRYQGEFADGIADVVVGQNIDDLNVDKVAGSSLTSGGFNEALEQIRAEARG